MKKAIITTTINEPTKATFKFCKIAEQRDWTFVIIGDTKTPHHLYNELAATYGKHVIYVHPDEQEKRWPELSSNIGWRTIQRRNIGFLYAYEIGADVIATIDDDNIPYDNWGTDLLVGQVVDVDIYENNIVNAFDPISVTNQQHIWHRGYPIEHVSVKNDISMVGREKREVLIQADFWDGDPDIDAICRLTHKPLVKFNKFDTFATNQPAPFNSQNTFIHRDVFPYYSVWPHVGRMDDIWASYYARDKFDRNIVYHNATVYQERNPQDLVRNLENECIGYRHTKTFIESGYNIQSDFIPDETKSFLEIYESSFNI